MNLRIKRKYSAGKAENQVILIPETKEIDEFDLPDKEKSFVVTQFKKGNKSVLINKYDYYLIFQLVAEHKEAHKVLENCRQTGYKVLKTIDQYKSEKITVSVPGGKPDWATAFAEGLALSNYQFLKYFKDRKKKANKLTEINLVHKGISEEAICRLNAVVTATCIARSLVNEPLSYLTAEQYSKEMTALGKKAGFSVEVWDKRKIESNKMGGLLAVNKGSLDPPTFNILEWKPKNAKNKKPYILVGKGIVYDTGGLSLKPTPNSMDQMKCDMAGSAAVVGTLHAVAESNLPIHVVGLIPATDNRPGGNAYVPGDVITMYNGSTVEVLNTDAEGRIVLADALTYAQKYQPELVIDLATLTGSAMRAIGTEGIVSMGTADKKTHETLKESGNQVYERVAELPFWEEYEEQVKSDIADIKNIGGPNAGAITAGKFLEYFTKDEKGNQAYPWIHLDIAGPAYLSGESSYRGKYGTGVGVRILYDFLKKMSDQ